MNWILRLLLCYTNQFISFLFWVWLIILIHRISFEFKYVFFFFSITAENQQLKNNFNRRQRRQRQQSQIEEQHALFKLATSNNLNRALSTDLETKTRDDQNEDGVKPSMIHTTTTSTAIISTDWIHRMIWTRQQYRIKSRIRATIT